MHLTTLFTAQPLQAIMSFCAMYGVKQCMGSSCVMYGVKQCMASSCVMYGVKQEGVGCSGAGQEPSAVTTPASCTPMLQQPPASPPPNTPVFPPPLRLGSTLPAPSHKVTVSRHYRTLLPLLPT
jgi:hypothetical protein